MPRPKAAARYIKASSIQIGDTIRVSGKFYDVDMSRTGTVHKRDHDNSGTTTYYTKDGVELLVIYRDGTTLHPASRITLLNRVTDLTLPGFDNE